MDVRTATAVFSAITSNPTGEPVVWEPLWNDALISRSRSLMASKLLTDEHLAAADVIVFIDDDIVFEPGDLWKIVEGARETGDIYGGGYVVRSREAHLSSRTLPDRGVIEFRQTPERRPVEVQYLATGFMAVPRSVVESVVAGEFRDADGTHRVHRCEVGGDRPFWPVFSPFTVREPDGRLHYLSEDWAFCERARQAGHRVWMDASIILQHMGWYPFTVADLREVDGGLPSSGTDRLEVAPRPEGMPEGEDEAA